MYCSLPKEDRPRSGTERRGSAGHTPVMFLLETESGAPALRRTRLCRATPTRKLRGATNPGDREPAQGGHRA